MKYFFVFFLLYCACVFSEISLTFSPSVWNLGNISDREIFRHSFTIKNSLSYPVKLTHVQTSCSCNAIFDLPPLLNPGEEKEFFVTLNPSGKMGRYLWELNIYTDSKEFPHLVLPVHAYVLRDTLLSEDTVHIKPFFKGEPLQKKIWIASRHKPDFQIFSVECNIKDFSIEAQKSPVEGFYKVDYGYVMLLSSSPQVEPGSKKGEILLKTDLPGHENLCIPVFTYVNGYIQTIPSYLAFGMMNPGESYRKILRVSHNQIQKPFQILEATASLPEIQIKVRALIPSHFYELEINWNLPLDTPKGEQRGYLEIRTDFEKEPLVKVPLQGIVFRKNS